MTADRMLLHGMVFYGYHGVSPEEQRLGQRFVVDVELETDLSKSGDSDDLADTIDYGKVYETVAPIVQGAPYRLLEALATAIANKVLQTFPVNGVLVRVKKPGVPLPGALDYAGVEVVRRRGG